MTLEHGEWKFSLEVKEWEDANDFRIWKWKTGFSVAAASVEAKNFEKMHVVETIFGHALLPAVGLQNWVHVYLVDLFLYYSIQPPVLGTLWSQFLFD